MSSVPVHNKFLSLPHTKKPPKGREWVYFLRSAVDPHLVKVGHATNLKWRLTGLQTQCPVQLSLIGLVEAPAGTECVFHEALDTDRAHGEWFYPTERLELLRKSLPKGGSIEGPEVVALVEPFGITKDVVSEIFVLSANWKKHQIGDERDLTPMQLEWKLKKIQSPIWRKCQREMINFKV